MSVLIKDMEKPKFCYAVIDGEPKRCPFVDAYDDCVILREKGIRTGTTWTDMYSKCPLVEVPEPQWIPCEERLPDETGLYLTKDSFGSSRKRWYSTADGWDVDGGCAPTAWMPTSEPYEEEKKK